MWNEITNQSNLDNFLKTYDYFHDSCIKELKYLSGAYVNEDLYMQPVNHKRILNIVFQRQRKNPSVIEMEFLGLHRLSIYTDSEDYTSEIQDATMILYSDCICWYDCGILSDSDLGNYKGTVIFASKVRWRIADEYLGQKVIYESVK